MRIVIPSSTDWRQSADFNSGTVLVAGRLAEMLYPDVWRVTRGAWAHALDPRPWDATHSANHAARIGGVTDAGAWKLDGTNAYLHAGTRANLDLPSSFTLSGWMYRDSTTGSDAIIGKRGALNNWPYIVFQLNASNKLTLFADNGSTVSVSSSADYEAATWHHFAITRSATAINFYKNGVADAGNPHSLAVGTSAPTHSTLIGANNQGSISGFWTGMLDDLRIDSAPLRPHQIQTLAARRYNAFRCRLLPGVFSFQ